MTTVVYDHEIFNWQQVGGVSRYICEVAQHVNELNGWKTCVVAPLHFNDHLRASRAPRRGWHIDHRWPNRTLCSRVVNTLVSPIVRAAINADITHLSYYGVNSISRSRPCVVTVHDMIHELFPSSFPRSDRTAERKKDCVARAQRIICVSESTAHDLAGLLNVPREKISVTHLGISEAFSTFRPSSPSPTVDRPYILFVGHRSGYKNFEQLLRAYAASRRLMREFDLWAFGGGVFSLEERALMTTLKLPPGSVKYRYGDDSALARAYDGATMFVYPSRYEGFGIPPLEAMSRKCAVVCSSSSSIPEVVGSAGLYFDPNSSESIRNAMETLADDSLLRQQLLSLGEARWRCFSWIKCAEETVRAYEAALS